MCVVWGRGKGELAVIASVWVEGAAYPVSPIGPWPGGRGGMGVGGKGSRGRG